MRLAFRVRLAMAVIALRPNLGPFAGPGEHVFRMCAQILRRANGNGDGHGTGELARVVCHRFAPSKGVFGLISARIYGQTGLGAPFRPDQCAMYTTGRARAVQGNPCTGAPSFAQHIRHSFASHVGVLPATVAGQIHVSGRTASTEGATPEPGANPSRVRSGTDPSRKMADGRTATF